MKISNAVIDSNIRTNLFNMLNVTEITGMVKINDRQYGILVTDENGDERYARVGVIVAAKREDMTAAELMQSEIDDYNTKQENKAKRAEERSEKAKRDKEKREAAKKEKEEKGE